jgi:hypothetical protein
VPGNARGGLRRRICERLRDFGEICELNFSESIWR